MLSNYLFVKGFQQLLEIPMKRPMNILHFPRNQNNFTELQMHSQGKTTVLQQHYKHCITNSVEELVRIPLEILFRKNNSRLVLPTLTHLWHDHRPKATMLSHGSQLFNALFIFNGKGNFTFT